MITPCDEQLIQTEIDQINTMVKTIESNVKSIQKRHVQYTARRTPFLGAIHALIWG